MFCFIYSCLCFSRFLSLAMYNISSINRLPASIQSSVLMRIDSRLSFGCARYAYSLHFHHTVFSARTHEQKYLALSRDPSRTCFLRCPFILFIRPSPPMMCIPTSATSTSRARSCCVHPSGGIDVQYPGTSDIIPVTAFAIQDPSSNLEASRLQNSHIVYIQRSGTCT